MPEHFKYSPLDDPRSQIRLVSLLPNSSKWISCKLEHANIDDGRDYIALSYAWSPPQLKEELKAEGKSESEKYEILINDRVASINYNLWLFLSTVQGLPWFDSNMLFWIDQICIDQSTAQQEAPGGTNEISEKSLQVEAMGTTFSRASEVLVWLGRAPRNSTLAVSYIKRASATPDVLEVNQEEYDALDCLFDNYYWKRRWIIQELFNATSVRFLYGAEIFDRSDLRHIIRIQVKSYSDLPSRGSGFDIPASTRRLLDRDRNIVPSQDNILDLMREFRESQCQSPHDRLYALLGMTTSAILIDYGKPIEYTLLEILKYAQKKEQARPSVQTSLINTSMTVGGLLGIELDTQDHTTMAKIAQNNATKENLRHGAGSRNENFRSLCLEQLQR